MRSGEWMGQKISDTEPKIQKGKRSGSFESTKWIDFLESKKYLQAESLKYKHSTAGKLTILMPLLCVVMSAVLTHVYFTVDSYNWWYVGISTGYISLLCGIISEKDKKLGNRAIWSLPCDMGKIWDAKVLYGIKMSGIAVGLHTAVTIVIAFFLEMILHVNFIIRPSVTAQLAAGVLLWLSYCWQIPWCLFLAQMIGRIPMLIFHFVWNSLMAVVMSLSPIYMFFPGALGPRMMCVLLKVMPNGLPAQVGEMTYAPRLIDPSSIPIGIAASIVWLLLLWAVTRKWYQRKVERV